jgi:hypothetical protein
MSVFNRLNKGSKFALTIKGADLSLVFYCVNEGKLMNAGDSITSKDEKPANMLLKNSKLKRFFLHIGFII